MGRPLNKKYMGNRNIGTTGAADNGIGGEGIASISVATAGSFVVSNTYKNFPLLNIGAPTLPGGVPATADVVFEIDTVTYASGGATNYVAGLSTAITGLGGGAVVNITTNGGGAVNAVNLTGGNRGEFRRGGAFDGTGITTFQVLQAPNTGTDLQINITFRVKSITILEKGSGYVAVPQLSWSGHTFTGQTTPSGNTPALTVDTGAVGSATNQENAILAYAYIGGNLVLVDLVKQISTKRYKVRYNGTNYTARIRYDAVADGTAGYTAAEGVELNMVALDSAGGSYLVRKLYNHTCTLNPVSIARLSATAGTLITAGKQTKWSFSAATTGVVQIENA